MRVSRRALSSLRLRASASASAITDGSRAHGPGEDTAARQRLPLTPQWQPGFAYACVVTSQSPRCGCRRHVERIRTQTSFEHINEVHAWSHKRPSFEHWTAGRVVGCLCLPACLPASHSHCHASMTQQHARLMKSCARPQLPATLNRSTVRWRSSS